MKYAIEKWNYFMSLAYLTSKRSKDPSTQCGASIVNTKDRIVGLGYNGMPNGCKYKFSWDRDGGFCDTKYAFVVHAEVNAIMNATDKLDGCMMFTTLFPCNECAKTIVQSGITTVVYHSDKYHDMDFSKAARMIFRAADVCTLEYSDCRDLFLTN